MEDRLRKIQRYTTAMADRYLSAGQQIALMEPFLATETADLFQNSYGAHCYGALARTLLFDLIRDIWAFVLDTDERSPSVKNIWQLLQDERLLNALRESARKPAHGEGTFDGEWSEEEKAKWQERWRNEDLARRENAFDAAVERLKPLPQVLESELAKKIAQARNKHISHYEMRMTKDGPKLHALKDVGLTWGDPKKFLEILEPTIWDLVLVCTWGSYDVEGFKRRSQLYAADFWARLKGKPPVEE